MDRSVKAMECLQMLLFEEELEAEREAANVRVAKWPHYAGIFSELVT